ncbi:MAG TPA: 30S ribosomal protein S17 [Patescibacteria group bacterium]|nr:30S ribosomal protein S17 [Patescibacteria group bacterium]
MKVFTGIVKSVAPKTAYVTVASSWMHPIYRKRVKQTNTFVCQDDVGVKVGATVEIGECRPISKQKHFTILNKEKVTRTAGSVIPEPEMQSQVSGIQNEKTKISKKKIVKK